MESRVFDTRTIQGLKQAEQYKLALCDRYAVVHVSPVGLYTVRIWAVRPIGGGK